MRSDDSSWKRLCRVPKVGLLISLDAHKFVLLWNYQFKSRHGQFRFKSGRTTPINWDQPPCAPR